MQVRDDITSCWNFLNLCRFNNSGYMLSQTGQSSRNTDSPQRNQPSVATTSWSREWNRAQGELFFTVYSGYTRPEYRSSCFGVSCEFFAIVCSTGGDAFVFASCWLLGTLKWVKLTLTTVFDFYFYLVLFAISAIQFSVLFKKKRLKRSCWKKKKFSSVSFWCDWYVFDGLS